MDNDTLLKISSHCHPNFTISSAYYYFCIKYMRGDDDLQDLRKLMCIVSPTVTVIGLIFNVMTLMVVKMDGLHKTSNIFLMGLLITDNMGLFGGLNFAVFILFYGPDRPYPQYPGFQYDHQFNYLMVFLERFCQFIGEWGLFLNSWFPVVITLDRLLAIFKPLHYARYLTPRRAVGVVVIIILAWVPYIVYRNTNFMVYEEPLTETRTYIGIKDVSVNVALNFGMVIFLECTISYIPLIFVTCGCVIIFLKIRLVIQQRRQLSRSEKKRSWSVRTTRTLLVTCLFFVIGNIIYDIFEIMASALLIYTFIAYSIHFLVICLSSTNNFFVYMICNPKLAKLFFTKLCHVQRLEKIQE